MRIFLTFLTLFGCALTFAQTVEFSYGGQITNYETGKKEGGVTVTVVANSVTLATSVTASNGKYVLTFTSPATAKYDIVFSKPGFVPKRVSFDLTNLNTGKIKEGQKLSPLMDLSMEIFTVKPGIDFSFLESEPVAKFTADPESANLTYDVSANQRMKQKIESLLDATAPDNSEAKYNEAIKRGEELFKENKLEEALKQFEAAAFLKPKELYPQKKIAEIDALLKAKKNETLAQNETDEQYNNLITAADNFRDKKQYSEALAKYRAALRVKNEQYPKDEVAKIEKIVNETAANERREREYLEAISAADAAMSAKQYDIAVKKYNEALVIKAEEKYPKDQIGIAEKELKALAESKEKQAQYDEAVKEGGLLFTQSKFQEAKEKYVIANGLKPSESLPKERIKMCDEQLAKLAESKKLEEEINALFEQGQVSIDKKDYTAAKTTYKKILGLDPKKNLAQIKLDEIDRLIKADEDAKNAEANFAKFVKMGDDAAIKEDFASAKQHYGAALEIKEDAVVKEKYNAVVANMANKEAKILVANKYEEIMKEGKELFDANELDKAKAKFQMAATIDDTKQEPKTKLAEIDALLNKNAEADKKYRALIDKGDELVKEKKYLEAIKQFDGASEMRPSETEPKEKSQEAARLSRESLDDENRQFERIIEAARENIDKKDFTKAKDLVNRAITTRPPNKRPEDSRPEDMLREINALEKTEKEYNGLISSAEKAATAKDYKNAIDLFSDASKLRPDESLPKERIAALEEELNSTMNAAQKEKSFQESYTKGLSEMKIKSYEMALESFKKAQSIKPEDQNVKDKISEVEQLLDEIAKANASDSERKLTVDRLIKEANTFFEKRDWSQAKNKYSEVVILDPEQPFSQARIKECDARLKEEMDAVADKEYKELIASADNNFEKKDFLRSKELFEKANSTRPSDPYPVQKLAELERLLNPSIVQTSALEPLGDVYDGEDAELDLAKAELERKNRKSEEFLATKNSAIDQIEEKTATLQDKTYANQKGLNEVEAKTSELATEATIKAQSSAEQVKQIKANATAKDEEDAAYDRAQNLLDQEKLNYIRQDLDLQAEADRNEIELKAAQMKDQTSQMAEANLTRSQVYSQASVDKGHQLAQVKIEAQESMNDDESRRLTEAQLKIAKENATDKLATMSEDQQAKVEHNEDRFREIVAINQIRTETFNERVEDNSEKIKDVEVANMESANEAYNREMEKHLAAKQNITNQENQLYQKALEEKERVEANQNAISNAKDMLEMDLADRSTADKEKEVHLQSSLDYVISEDARKKAEEVERQNENAEIIKKINNQAIETQAELAQDKQQKQLTSQETLDDVKTANAEQSQESTDKQMKNASAVEDIYTIEAIRKEDLAKKAQQNQRATTEKINKVETTPVVEKSKNTLGMDYPEGVTEEKFSQKGPDGTIKAIITRRVVVVDGHGDVYVRTQSNGVSTYKKNNESITEYIWQRETQNSSLVRH